MPRRVQALQRLLLGFQIHNMQTRGNIRCPGCCLENGAGGAKGNDGQKHFQECWTNHAAHRATHVAERQEPIGGAPCEEGACGELHLSEAAEHSATQSLNARGHHPDQLQMTSGRAATTLLGAQQLLDKPLGLFPGPATP